MIFYNYNLWQPYFRTVIINFGPQHPSAHGVLRLITEMDGETILQVEPHIGLLHRGTEKLLEWKTFLQGIPYFDRLDYVSMMSQEHTFVSAIEFIGKFAVPLRAQFIRVLFLEITRILNHLIAITTHALDVGALTPFLWMFEEREKLMEFYERVSGARMHAAYIRPGGVFMDLPIGLLDDINLFINQFTSRIEEIEDTLSFNRIRKSRLTDIGIMTKEKAETYGCTGVLLRSAGVQWDLRKNSPYEIYSKSEFQVPVGKYGDSYDRYILRMEEMRQSISLIYQCINQIPNGIFKNEDTNITSPLHPLANRTMEMVIDHFRLYCDGFSLEDSTNYICTETPKGEFGVLMATNGTTRPYRCKIRSPGFFHLQSLDFLSYRLMLADLVAIIGSIDIVFGEIDR